MQPWAVIDFETRSACDLKKSGAFRYAEDPSTSVLCLGIVWADGSTELWTRGDVAPVKLWEHVRAGRPVIAHNLQFEWAIWHSALVPQGWPPLTIAQCDDTMARARAMSLPAALGDCAEALRLPVKKDLEGHRVMMQLSRPRTREPLTFWEPETAPNKFQKLYEYCITDVIVEHQLHTILPPLTPTERKVWELDLKINARGFALDVENIPRALKVLESEKHELSARVFKMTGGAATATQRDALLSWLQSEDMEIDALTKTAVSKAIAKEGGSDVAKAVLALRKEAAKGSTAKLSAMAKCACSDGSAKGLLQYHGASTGRWAGKLIQTQNMPRTTKKFGAAEAEDSIYWLRYPTAGRIIRHQYGSVMDALSLSLRSFIVARPGKRFVAADFSNIEGRVLAWLAGEEWKLEAFREFDAGRGHDLYKLAYANSFGVSVESVDDAARQIGKVQELALGFQGGIGSYISMGANYGVVPAVIGEAVKRATAPEDWERAAAKLPKISSKFRYELEPDAWTGLRIVVDGWRAAHPAIRSLWRALEDAAIFAVENPGAVAEAGPKIRYKMDGDFLLCRLPSGRKIAYPYAAIKYFPSMGWEEREREIKSALKDVETPEAKAQFEALLAEHKKNVEWQKSLTYWGVSSKAGSSKKWKLQRAYGGLLAENATQATARDCLAEAMLRVEGAPYEIVMHVHDEILVEADADQGSVEDLAHKMCAQDAWAEGLPIAAAGWDGLRYRK